MRGTYSKAVVSGEILQHVFFDFRTVLGSVRRNVFSCCMEKATILASAPPPIPSFDAPAPPDEEAARLL